MKRKKSPTRRSYVSAGEVGIADRARFAERWCGKCGKFGGGCGGDVESARLYVTGDGDLACTRYVCEVSTW